jgi:hypothetical protein
MRVSVLYIVAFPLGKEPDQFFGLTRARKSR